MSPGALVGAAGIGLGLLVWGSHALLPWRLRLERSELDPARQAWSLAALPLLLLATVLTLLRVLGQPDATLAVRLDPLQGGGPISRLVLVLVIALVCVDVLLAAAGRKLEPAGWMIAALVGVAALAALSAAGELLRAGEGLSSNPAMFALTAACRLALALACAELLAPWPSGRPRLAALGALAIPVWLAAIPRSLVAELFHQGADWTAAVAVLCFVASLLLPGVWKRVALAGALLNSALLLGLAAERSVTTLPRLFESA